MEGQEAPAWDAAAPGSMFQTLYSYFWWDQLWLPVNLTWADLEDHDGRVYAKASDLYISIPFAFLFLVVRHLFEIYVATPLARALGVKEKIRLRAAPVPVLENFYATCTKHPKQVDVESLSRKSGCTVRQVERWFRRRRNQDRPSLLKKFREASWRFTFYLLAFIAGMAVIVDKPWFSDLRVVWNGFPKQTMLSSQYWYYMVELGFYWSLLFSVASDVKRKDFKEQVIHHVATIVLISFSWCANYIRIGTLVMAIHDASDYLLESAKMFNYAGWKETCNNIFVVFAAVFIVTRLIIFPFWILHCTWVYPVETYPAFFGYYFFNAMLVVLQCLHVFWAYLILRMAYKFLSGKLVEDERSDHDETDLSEEEDTTMMKNGPVSNGHGLLNNNHQKAE
ncbi:ceramide synthase 2 [Microcaecilia unicolor]|uniref:Ceramide synthase 2 n=1 Tax=Microcaecilia unicolor TaxID=1415580 RepID=A0A6P7WR97_9AMPH|nr:ceramide synthase 2 [Microcaecilia unicolor]